MRVSSFILSLLLTATAAFGGSVKVYIAPQTTVIPGSGKISFDIYWINDSERPAAIPAPERYVFIYWASIGCSPPDWKCAGSIPPVEIARSRAGQSSTTPPPYPSTSSRMTWWPLARSFVATKSVSKATPLRFPNHPRPNHAKEPTPPDLFMTSLEVQPSICSQPRARRRGSSCSS